MRKIMLTACTALVATAADAGTTVADLNPERPVVGYNYDFPIGQGLVVINKRGLSKSSAAWMSSGPQAKPATWQSRFASVTFVQFGRDNPMAGMNERGLVVSQMWLDGARYEDPDARPVLGVLEWMQHLLDTAGSVEEALKRSRDIRIQSGVPLHYALVDSSGRAAFVEFLKGTRIVHTGQGLPQAVLTNSPYAESLDFLANQRGRETPDGPASLARFARAAARLGSNGPGGVTERAFHTLASVAQPSHTRWSIVFDPKNLAVHWRSDENAAIRKVSLNAFDPSCRTPTQTFSVHEGSGEVSERFRPYTPVENDALVTASYRQTPFLAVRGPEAALSIARAPDASVCAE